METTSIAAHLRVVIARTARRLRQEAGDDLSPSQAATLATIERRGPLTPSEVARCERIQRPTATRVLARLEDAGLIARAADPADGRSSLVSITDEGRALLERLRTRKDLFLARRLDELEPGEIATLERAADILERVLER
jgi:DNA-binding MarR family transcriptional regulator